MNFRLEQKKHRKDEVLQEPAERKRPQSWISLIVVLEDRRSASEAGSGAYLAALTDVTAMVFSFSVPVTVAFAPACLSSVASAALSLVSSV